MKRCRNSIICFFFVVIRRKNDPFFLRMTTLKIQILNFPLSRRRSKKGARNSLFYLFIDARRKKQIGSKGRSATTTEWMKNVTKAATAVITTRRLRTRRTRASSPRATSPASQATRVWTSMCAYTTATRWRRLQRAPEARSSFLFRSSLRRSVVYEKTN